MVGARQVLVDAGFASPVWEDLARVLRPDPTPDKDPSSPEQEGQYWATQPLNGRFIEAAVRPRLPDSSRAMLRSQSGPLASVPFTCCPISRHTNFDAQIFRTFLLRRLWLPLSSSSRACRCGRPLARLWRLPVEGRTSVTLSSSGDRGERDWLSWRPKWEEGGHRRLRTFRSNWPKLRSAMSRRL